MRDLATFLGFVAAHAIWSVSEGEDLIPIFASELGSGQRMSSRIVSDTLEQGVATGREWLEANHDKSIRSVLAYDGYYTFPDGKTDAIVLDARQFDDPQLQIGMAVPYRNAKKPDGFAVFRPKLLALSGILDAEVQPMVEECFRGIDSHEPASALWNSVIDQSR